MSSFDPSRVDPAALRLEREQAASSLAQRAFAKCESLKVLAAHLGVSVFHLYKCADKASKRQVKFSEIKGFPREMARVYAEDLAEQIGCTLIDNARAAESDCDFRSLADAAKACGNTVSAFSGALADRHIDPKEAETIAQEAKRAIACLHQIVDRAKQVVSARGSAVRVAS